MLGDIIDKKILSYAANLSIPELWSPEKFYRIPISDTSVSSEHSNFSKGRKVQIFSKNLTNESTT